MKNCEKAARKIGFRSESDEEEYEDEDEGGEPVFEGNVQDLGEYLANMAGGVGGEAGGPVINFSPVINVNVKSGKKCKCKCKKCKK
jgi:hypothetical protein